MDLDRTGPAALGSLWPWQQAGSMNPYCTNIIMSFCVEIVVMYQYTVEPLYKHPVDKHT